MKHGVLLFLLITTGLTQAVHASYYDTGSDLTYGLSDEVSGNSWRDATEDDIASLFGLSTLWQQATVGSYNQLYVDIILGLGGNIVSGSVGPGASGTLRLDGVHIYDETIGGKQELWFDYVFGVGIGQLDILGPAAELNDYCGNGGISCDIPGIVVSTVPVPAAAWLFGSALIGLAGIKRKK
jgi:hypothetical protein